MSMRSIYRHIAKKYGVSVAEVKRDMKAAINQTYQDKRESERIRQKSFPCDGEIPTPEEFIFYIAQEVRGKL